jgi:hypothetical protein
MCRILPTVGDPICTGIFHTSAKDSRTSPRTGKAGPIRAVLLTGQVLLVTREPRRHPQRTAEAARLLSAADLTVSALDGGQVTTLLTTSADPGAAIHASRLAVPGQVVTSPGTLP